MNVGELESLVVIFSLFSSAGEFPIVTEEREEERFSSGWKEKKEKKNVYPKTHVTIVISRSFKNSQHTVFAASESTVTSPWFLPQNLLASKLAPAITVSAPGMMMQS